MTESTLDKVIGVGGAILALDSIIFPFLTGKALHEYLGFASASDYKILGERTALMAEQAVAGISMIYRAFTNKYLW